MEIERTIEILEGHLYSGKMPSTEHFEALAVAVQALKRQRWIPCGERLPEDADFFPVVIDDDIHGIITGYACWSGEYWTPIYTDLKLTDDVLYWMSLPEPPEEGGAGNERRYSI